MSAQDNLNKQQFETTFSQDYHGRHAVTTWPAGQVGTEYDHPIGSLHWHPEEGYITYLNVSENYRRQGIATSMYHRANEEATAHGLRPPTHSVSRSDEGNAWARAVGGRLPKREEDGQ